MPIDIFIIPPYMNLKPIAKPTNRDMRFEYLEALCDAIELYAAQLQSRNSQIFIYKKSNLRYAFERALYFFLADNFELYSLFLKWKESDFLSKCILTSPLLRKIAFCMTGKTFPSKGNSRGRFVAESIKRILGDLKRSTFRKRNVQLSSCISNPEVIFLIDHSRYIDFLFPITNALAHSYAYLVIENVDLEQRLKQEGIPVISCRLNVSISNLTFSNDLFPFRGLLTLYDLLYEELSQLMPHSVVVVEGNFAEDEIINQVCKRLALPTYCIQQGWSPIIHNGFRNMSFDNMFVWGEGFSELLQPHNPHQKFTSVGSHVLISKSNSQTSSKNAISFFLQAPYKLVTPEMWVDFIGLIQWTAQKFINIPVLVREHPRHKISDSEAEKLLVNSNVQLTPPGKFSLEEVLSESFMSVSIYSSTIMESIAAGTFPLIVNLTSMPRFNPDLDSLGAAIEVKSIEKAKEAIDSVVNNPDNLLDYQKKIQQISPKFFCNSGKEVVHRLIQEILSIDFVCH